MAVACLIYATVISHESIWYDEAYSSKGFYNKVT